MTESGPADGIEALSDFLKHPVGLAVAGLITLAVVMIPKAGTSFRMKSVQFPWAWLLGVGAPAVAIALFFAARSSAGFTDPKHLFWPGFAALLLLFVGGAPLIHRLSGYHPAAIDLTLSGWRTRRGELLNALRQHFDALGLTPENEQRWRADLAARGMVKGTVAPNKRIPYLVFVRLDERGRDLGVKITAENMDIVISDTGESKNCEVLLSAVLAPFDEPPLKEAAAVNVNFEVTPRG